jgi:hypothetical protein
MAELKSLKPLAAVFFAGGIWDLFAALVYTFLIGTVYTDPTVHRFYAFFIASFLICFAFLQLLSAFNIRRYLLVIGAVTIGRLLYVLLLFAYILGVPGFPATFWWTGVIDGILAVLNIVLAVSCGVRIGDLFLPAPEGR